MYIYIVEDYAFVIIVNCRLYGIKYDQGQKYTNINFKDFQNK